MDEGELEALEGVIIMSTFKRTEVADRGGFEGHVSRDFGSDSAGFAGIPMLCDYLDRKVDGFVSSLIHLPSFLFS